jgi:hypothetical protein
MSDFKKHLEESLKDEGFKQDWDKLEFRYAVIKEIIKIRNSILKINCSLFYKFKFYFHFLFNIKN